MPKGNIKRRVSGVGPRLKDELAERGISVRSFQRELAAEGVRGSAYATLWSYLQGRVEPAPEFVLAVADKLGLREEYLARGELPKTPAEQRVSEVERGSEAEAVLLIDQELDRLRMTPGTKALFHDAWRRYVAGPKGGIPDKNLLDAAGTLMRTLLHVTYLWGFRHHWDTDRQTNDFYVAMLHAMMLAMPESGFGDRVDEVGVLWPTGTQPVWHPDRELRRQRMAAEAGLPANWLFGFDPP